VLCPYKLYQSRLKVPQNNNSFEKKPHIPNNKKKNNNGKISDSKNITKDTRRE